MEFDSQLEQLREEKKQLEDEIRTIEAELDEKSSNTRQLRSDLEDLKTSVETGEVPDDDSGDVSAVDGIPRVDVDPESGRPPRGARSDQIEKAIDFIEEKRGKEEFKAAYLFGLLKEADPSIDENQRAYLYSKLKDLGEAGRLEKVGRGRWRIVD